MNILIVENEVYLAQKIVSRLLDDGHNCDFVESVHLENITKDYDIILLSTAIPSNICKSIIKKYAQSSIILLMVSYISDETVTNPIKDGAKDYIMKPFLMDELVRKIYHYKECRTIRRELSILKEYYNFTMNSIDTSDIILPLSFPLMVETNHQKLSDKIVFETAKKLAMNIEFDSFSSSSWQKKLTNLNNKTILYITDYHLLKKSSKELLNKQIEDKNVIISSFEDSEDFIYKKIILNSENISNDTNTILSINDYVKMVVSTYQNKYPDTELSKKLGISRKSLWEKRKKLDIEKKK
ncbi:DNA-binding transcriptional response regulator [Arcobacter porcinus]|uniref:Response regulator receiver domain-containing protein n=1 Tax=Arcobacter porcinus TaxID=1935204 RepID=A0A1C0AX98_9BACT|nr:response regulator transcription factor [Arcobacter porcinus]OCL97239.1 Transcriptional regulatory protein BasR [Aliarcobacter thereius]OCL84140.1 Transcriptional regulatory protein BasR [Arcobacter porcinus]OCL89204.1 Transcriptional regulatory protein BasR [Arcobacter porcinus]OCL91624.1 Transcriptional regulatory protein BasR [Arcobacter porcinus]QEP39761.1 response regulator receiver domain-containing protein [Arcobacter porcinus]